ncbi:MAG: gamma-glutamylcyclotransferase [Phycisphaerae bacterium]|nr:gamma-glutamylcyclotransferase [Phycisphaerae bacterium]
MLQCRAAPRRDAMGKSEQGKPFYLFVYGTLMRPEVFRAVLGRWLVRYAQQADGRETFHARPGVLDGYKKVSPDRTYQYAVEDPHGRIRGYVVGPLPSELMSALREYEGKNYSKRTLKVQTQDGPVRAVAFVANRKQLEHAFGHAFRDPLKQEILLDDKIERALIETEREHLHTTEALARRAVGELHGPTIRDLVRRHFEAGGISDYAIRHALKDAPLRDFAHLVDDPEAAALAPNYLTLVVRQVIFNQIEEAIHRDFRYELDRMGPSSHYYDRAISSLAALRILNANNALLELLMGDCLTELDFAADHLVDYVRWAIVAADSLYEPHQVSSELNFIRSHMGTGYISLGAELEFSNIGHDVIRDPSGHDRRDSRYDGFLYFRDFALDALTWKLGGHIDDHHRKTSEGPRRGFFEIAPGNLSLKENISKPLTDDAWTLNQLIHEGRQFYAGIAPHSVHLSLQLRRQHKPDRNRILPMAVMKCLFAIGGDPQRDDDGYVRIRRLTSDEIISRDGAPRMLLSEISVRHSRGGAEDHPSIRTPDSGGRYVQQFRFLRLSPTLNYEPIILALKGIQVRLRPGTFLTGSQAETSDRHRRAFEALVEWGRQPTALSEKDMTTFLDAVSEGLHAEKRGKAAHSGAYIAWAVSQLRAMCRRFNEQVTHRP